MIVSLTFLFSSCNNRFQVSETIGIKTTKNSIDRDYENLCAVVKNINSGQIQEKLYARYPEIIRHYVEGVKIKSIKTTKYLKKELNNVKTKSEAHNMFVKIEMKYDKSKSEQAMRIIKDYKSLLNDEFIKFNIGIEE